MHHHHWDAWLHIPLAIIYGSMPWWIEKIESGGHVLTALAPYIATAIGILQLAYLIRKHLHLGK